MSLKSNSYMIALAISAISPAAMAAGHKHAKPVEGEHPTEPSSSLELSHFRVSLNTAYQGTGGYSISAGGSWNPSYRLNETVKVVSLLGASEYNTELGTYFTAIEYGAFASFAIADKSELEVGAGAQYWLGDGGNVNEPTIGINYVYDRAAREATFKKVIVGYAAVIISKMTTHVFKLAVEI